MSRAKTSGWNGTPEKGEPERYAELARDVVNTHPDLILAVGAHLSLDFKMATTTIPIVTVVYRSDCPRSCGKHRAAGRQHHRRYYRRGIGNNWKTYGAAGRGNAKTVHRRLSCIATILGRCRGAAAREAAKRAGIVLSPAMLGTAFNEAEYQRVFTSMEQDRVDALHGI